MSDKEASIPEDIAAMSFEAALAALEEIVTRLESGDVGLEDSIEIYARGTALRQHCEDKLKLAEARIEKVTASLPGKADGSAPFDAD